MTKITKDDVLRVAQLAHLELGEGEVESLTRQLDSILSYVAKLDELDTEGVEPMSQPAAQPIAVKGGPDHAADVEDDLEAAALRVAALGTPLREDIHVQSTVIDEVLAGAPDPEPPYFRVPKVIELPKASSGPMENDK
jgi:aspartyl-tRNA(Asn)/glutamyl-tRNA(Gln) amidotransferase subunit C